MKKGQVSKIVRTTTDETAEARVERLYQTKGSGGPLIAWLLDEAKQQGISFKEMSDLLGVTYGYINQLRTGIRQTETIGQGFAEECAKFLGVPAIIVKILAGRVSMRDFAWPAEGEEGLINRAYRKMMADPAARQHLMPDVESLPFEAKRSLVMMYSETTGQDIMGLRHLSSVMRYLQRAAMTHYGNYESYCPIETKRQVAA
jgi:transcriptional regulator with XRE-family HTH domain